MRVYRFVRDPLITIANSRWTVLTALSLTVLIYAGIFCLLEQSNPHLQGHPKAGYWVACYWAITTMTTVGYGDVSPVTTQGQFVACTLMLWSTFFLLPVAVVNVYNGVVKDRNEWSDAEQEQLKNDIRDIKNAIADQDARMMPS